MGIHSFFRGAFRGIFYPRVLAGCDAANGEWAIDRHVHLDIADELRSRVGGSPAGRFVTVRLERTKRGVVSEMHDRYDEDDAGDAARCERRVVAWLSTAK